MNETIKLIKAQQNNLGEITWAEALVTFEDSGHSASHYIETDFNPPLVGNYTKEEILEETLRVTNYYLHREKILEGVASFIDKQIKRSAGTTIFQDPPEFITALQGMLAIEQAGLYNEFNNWINNSQLSPVEKAYIDKANIWKRNDLLLNNIAKNVLNLSDEQIDNLFITASNL